MARVFLSYDREDVDRARLIALALEQGGHSVWWDRHIKGGSQYSKEIERALKAANAVVVLWSERSVESAWVRDEAAAGRDTGRLVPVLIDGTEPPLGFRQYQAIDLARWKGRGHRSELDELLATVAALGDGARPAPVEDARPPRRFTARPLLIAIAAIVVLAAVSAVWWFLRPSASIPTVTVAAAEPSAMSQALARNLLTKIGSLQAVKAESMRLAEHGEGAGKRADLIFEVGGTSSAQQAAASLMLLSGMDRTLLWSHEFQQPASKLPDLKQQLAYTAALVLGCALEAFPEDGPRLKQQTLKLYLNGCSAHADTSVEGLRELVSVFREVTREAPRFEGGWAKLLLVESELVGGLDFLDEAKPIRQALRAHIAAARKVNPKLAEADLAEASLMPRNAIAERIGRVERAVNNDPANADAISVYSLHLQQVGRMRESVRQAQRAAELAPLSPAKRDNLIGALTYSAEFESALEELRKAEQLWPGASNLSEARYRLHLRYGDPEEALRLQVSRKDIVEIGVRNAFLQARIDPSPANVDRAIAGPRTWFRRYPESIAELAQVLGAFGREEELFPILLNWRHPEKNEYVFDVLFRPALRNFRHDPRMMAVAKRLGLLAYWQKFGLWPDFCFEPDLPYDCRAEAAKLAA